MDAEFFPEQAIDGFNHRDGTVLFYTFVKAIYTKYPDGPRVLDFGAGRGAWVEQVTSVYKRRLQDLRDGASRATAADVDKAVLGNECSHAQVLLEIGEPLPFEDASFDIVVADYVVEHLDDPELIVSEIRRVLAPGGWFCFRTSNKWCYIAIGARMLPESMHGRILGKTQPDREEQDIFPTVYKLNTPGAFHQHLGGFDFYTIPYDGLPAYHMNRRWFYRLLRVVHWLLPERLTINYFVFAQKTS